MEYGVEYHVLQEELSSPSPEIKKIKHLEEMNKSLMQQNKILHEQLEVNLYSNLIIVNIAEYKINMVLKTVLIHFFDANFLGSVV